LQPTCGIDDDADPGRQKASDEPTPFAEQWSERGGEEVWGSGDTVEVKGSQNIDYAAVVAEVLYAGTGPSPAPTYKLGWIKVDSCCSSPHRLNPDG
jgi:hypothetical protein